MKVNALKCLKCNSIIFSRARHDFHPCVCGNIFIDGGFDYMRAGFREANSYEQLELEVEQNRQILYDDWNTGADKFGLIKPQKIKKEKKVKEDFK